MKSKILPALCLALSTACGGAALPSHFQAPVAPTEEAVAAHVSRARPRTERPVVVALTTKPTRLCAWDLGAGLLWQVPMDAKSRPLVVGDAVVIHEASGITVRDLGTGAVRARLEEDGRLIGADGVGNEIVVAIADAEEPESGELVYLRGSRVMWRRPLSQAVGTPALVGDQVLAPWGHQRLSVLSSVDGSELSRWEFTNLALAQAVVDRERVYVGQHGLLRVSAELPAHREGPLDPYSPLKRALPGQPPLLRDGYATVAEPGHASERVSATFRPAASDVPGAEQDLLLSRFYRVLIGMQASEDSVRFVRSFEHDLVASSVEPGYSLVVDAAGSVRALDAEGADLYTQQLGESLQVATLRAGAWSPAATPPRDASTPPAPPSNVTPEALHTQLLAVAHLTDERLGAVRMFALTKLAAQDVPSVTAELVQFCADRATAEAVRNTACALVAECDSGGASVVEALRARASFLEGTAEPPVGALARASSRMKLAPAAALLLSHAEDPHTSAADLVSVFEALDALNHRPAIGMLERFVRLHHAEPAGSELSKPLYAALTALGNLRAKNTRETLEYVAADGLALEPVRQKAREILGVIDSPPRVEKPVEKLEPVPVLKPVPEPLAVETDPRPWSVSGESVLTTLSPVRAQLLRCLREDGTKPRSARIAMVLTGQGEVEGSFVTPTSAQPCMEPVLRALRFPETRMGRQHVTHTLSLSDSVVPESAPQAAPKTRPR